jgi:hypothetical protein
MLKSLALGTDLRLTEKALRPVAPGKAGKEGGLSDV